MRTADVTRTTERLLKELEDVPTVDHQLADYFELRCAISAEGIYTGSDLAVAIKRRRDLGRAGERGLGATIRRVAGRDSSLREALGTAIDDGEAPAEGDQLEREALAAEPPNATAPEPAVDTISDELAARIGEITHLLKRRARRFGPAYPFAFEDEAILRLQSTPFSAGQRIYLYLLIASSYKFLARSHDRDKTTKSFERLALPVLKAYFGPRLNVHVFGTGARRGSRYDRPLVAAIERMSADTRLETTKRWDANKHTLAGGGDRGLDVVGWMPFENSDPEDLRLVLFGQCATGKRWQTKQLEASKPHWERSLNISNPLILVLLISYSWRDASGMWPQTLKLASENVVFDRERIVSLLDGVQRVRDVPISVAMEFVGLADATYA